MARSLVISLIGAAGMVAALLVGCGDNDAKPVASKEGESCARTADCADGLTCISNVCYKSGSTGGGGEAGQTSVPGPVLGGVGESCSSRLDCSTGLACFNQRCTDTTSTGEGGAPSTPTAQLGDRGETCRVNADCSTGLICVPGYVTSGVGQCDLATYGYKPSDKSCVGECTSDADCCELPVAEHDALVESCADITEQLGKVDCSSAALSTTDARYCFLQATYCSCAKGTWTCDANSQCQYTGKCSAATTDTLGGCPQYTRAQTIVPSCDTKAGKCQGPATVVACKADADCDAGLAIYDHPLQTCAKGECTCYSGQCYHACTQDIDCDAGKVCDTKKTNLCVPQTGCTEDVECAKQPLAANPGIQGRVGDKCVDSACKRPCASDHDCSASGLVVGSAFNGLICSAAGYCESVGSGCTSDAQCTTQLGGGVRAFCVTTPEGSTATTVSSAVTD